MSKHTIDLYTINYRVIIIKNSNGQNHSKCVRLGLFLPQNKTKPKKHYKEYDHKTTHVVCIDKSIFVNTSIYIYQQLIHTQSVIVDSHSSSHGNTIPTYTRVEWRNLQTIFNNEKGGNKEWETQTRIKKHSWYNQVTKN